MPTIEDLLKMNSSEVYGQAVRAGIESAMKGSSPDALKKWFGQHPEFSDPQVGALMDLGAAEGLLNVLKILGESSDSNCMAVINRTDQGDETFSF